MPNAYAAALASGATRLARCFLLERRDGTRLAFTDHDEPLAFAGDTYEPGTALSASETQAQLGLAADELDVSGALSSEAITEADLAAGLYDDAALFLYEVDWSDTSVRRLLGRYRLGQVERGRLTFTAELRGRSTAADVAEGRVHARLCDVERLGDARCKVSLGPWQSTVSVTAADGLSVTVTGLGQAPDFYQRGTLDWLTGDSAGSSVDIRAGADAGGGAVRLELWRAPPFPVQVGDTATATVGCDRTFETCRTRFANGDNHRGFPFMPGAGFVGEYGVTGQPGQDGGSRNG